MKKEMLINVLQPEECRIAIVEDGVLEELYVERSSQESYVGNIYKGRIVNIEPSIQAAFVDFGIGRNGFLHVSDVDPAYYKHLLSREVLEEYEAELEREYTGGGESDRGRGGRGGRSRGGRDRGATQPPPREVTSWLEPQPAPPPMPTAEEEEEPLDFAAGIVDEGTAVEEVAEGEFVAAEEDQFTDGIVEGTAALAVEAPELHAPRPVTAEHQKPRHLPTPQPIDEEAPAEFGAGVVDDEASDFGAGILDPESAEAQEPANESDGPQAEAAVAEEAPPASESPEVEVVIEPVEAAEIAEAVEPKARKPRTRRTKKAEEPKSEETPSPAEPAEGTAEAPPEKPKGRTRRTRKKTDGEGEAAEGGAEGQAEQPEDKPKYMGGAERRTSPGDDEEPEIRPFFEGGLADDFDTEGPNDRFVASEASAGEEEADVEAVVPKFDSEPAEIAEEEAREYAKEGPVAPQRTRESVHTGRGFNDDFEDARPPRVERERDRDRGRGGRDRGRGGRDRDRGDRDRDRGRGGPGRDRGPRGGNGGGRNGGRDRGLPKPPIQEIFKRGQEVIVQVIKEGIGTKGPTLSTYISIAGRYLVLMPSLNRVGVSRKIEDHDARKRLREIMLTLSPPKGVGFIVRTAAVDRDAQELRNDLAYLLRLWQVVVRRIKRVSAPVEIYRESDMITRTIRDIFTNDVDSIWVDEPTAFAHASEFLQIVMPRYASRIRFFGDTEPLFHRYGIEEEITKIHQKRIDLPEGGSLIIEQTEALVAIDVNSGNFRADNNAEETAYQMNLRAAKEIARQLRLRDLGGVIVNDFIDMREEKHRRNVENALRDAMRRDRARTKILRISQFGLIEMTRQRIRPSLKRSIFADCPHCRGSGFVKTNESMSIEVMRMLQLAAHRTPSIQSIEVAVHTDVANYLLNRKRKEIAALEERAKMEVLIAGQAGVSPDTCGFKCFDHNGNEVRLVPPPAPRLSGGRQPRQLPERERRYPQPLD